MRGGEVPGVFCVFEIFGARGQLFCPVFAIVVGIRYNREKGKGSFGRRISWCLGQMEIFWSIITFYFSLVLFISLLMFSKSLLHFL